MWKDKKKSKINEETHQGNLIMRKVLVPDGCTKVSQKRFYKSNWTSQTWTPLQKFEPEKQFRKF